MRASRSDDSPTASGLTRCKSWAAATPGATPITTTIINATKRCFMIPPARRPGRHDSRSSRGRFDPPPCRPARRHRMSEIRDGMRIEWHVPITMDDGIVLRADVYRPIPDGRYPVILSHGVYAKGLSYQEGYPMQWQKMVLDHPEILEGSTNKYQAWEVTDPERWVVHGYAIVRVDSRGSGWSPGYLDPLCPREDHDLAACIEWAGTRPWSNGKVGMLGISYYAINQWRVGGKRHPPHLAAPTPGSRSPGWKHSPTTTSPRTAPTLTWTSSPIRCATNGTGSARPISRRSRCRSCRARTGEVRASTRAATSTRSSRRRRRRSGSRSTASRTGRSSRPAPASRCRRSSSTTS